MNREELRQLSEDELIDVIFDLRTQNERLERRVAEFEAKANQPRKTARYSSLPPSQDDKPNKRRKGSSDKTGQGG